MRTFRLGDAELVALAAGRPSRRTLAELRRAQLSRHLLLLHAAGPAPRWYAEPTAHRDLADPMRMLHTAATLAARRAGAPPPPEPVASARFLSAEHDGLRLRVRLEDTDPLRDRLGLTPTAALSDAEADAWQREFTAAWRLLVARHRPAAAALADVLSVIVPVVADPGAGGISATSADAFGAVAMSAPADATALAVGLLHEAQHSVLNAVGVLFDLVRPGGPAGYSPWRDDPRPASGILHGAYAYLSVTRFWRAEARGGRLGQFEFARWRGAVAGAADELLAAGRLTAAGRRFTEALRAEAAGWLAEPVDALAGRLAEGANVDHRVRWRLRNLAVEPAAVAALVHAWRSGAAAPAAAGVVLRPAVRRELERSERLTLVHRFLRDRSPRPGGGVRPGDEAYLGARYGSAVDAYLKDLAGAAGDSSVSPREAAVWGGLALVLPQPALRERPEAVRALWAALRAEAADPRDIATWLSRSR